MLKIPKQISVSLSMIIAILFFLICITGLFILPELTQVLIDLPDNIGSRDQITQIGRVLVLFAAYCIVLTFLLADGLLMTLLVRVRKGLVFTDATVSLIRGVSWCCYLLCALFAFLGYYFQLALIVSFLAVFLGLCLRVCKNAFEEANAIKCENDLTV